MVLDAAAPHGSGGGEGGGRQPKKNARLPGDRAKFPNLDAWVRIGGDERVTVFTGKAELGTGV